MAYLTFVEYQELGGTIENLELFESLEFEAEVLINSVTFNRLKADTTICQEVKRLVYYLINIAKTKADTLSLGLNSTSQVTGPFITNESNDGVSVSYSSMRADTLYNVCEEEMKLAIKRYLQNVTNEAGRKVLYRGLYPGE